MKKWFLAATVVAVALLVLGEMSPAYAGGKGKKCGKGWGAQKPEIDVTSDKEQYYLGEKAHFVVDITFPKCRKMKMYEVYATFPDEMTPVELTKTGPTQFEYESGAFTEVGSKTLTVRLYHRGTIKAIESLEQNAERFRRHIACLEKLLENPELPGWMRNAIEHVIESLEKRLWAIEWVISRLQDMYVAEGGKTIDVVYRPPEAPTSLLCEGEEAPDNVRTRQPHFSAVFIDLDPGDMGTDYRVQVSKDEQFSQIVWDSGKAWLTEFITSGERCEDIECGVELSDETDYWWRIRFWDHHNLEGKWSQTAWFKVGDLTPPEPPVVEEQPPEGGVLSTSTVHLSGQAEPGSTVLIYGSPALLATVPVGANGLWAVDLILPDGWHDLTIYVRDPAGNLSPPWTIWFAVDTTAPNTVASPAGGIYTAVQTVELVATDNLTRAPMIYWTVDGTDPDPSSPVYTEPIEIAVNTTLKFRAVDSVGNWEPVKIEEYFISLPPVAEFSVDLTYGRAPLAVQFADESTGDVTTWEWDFDNDGIVDSTSQNPPYTYNVAGWYTVKLTVSGPAGSDTCVKEMHILVGNNVWYIDGNVVASGDGMSWDTAFKTIQEGLTSAGNRDMVLVAEGVYSGIGNKDLDFVGRIVYLQAIGGAENCIIDCENSGRGLYFHSGETANAIADGFTIRNGNVGVDRGGGISCKNHSSPTITNCIIEINKATLGGGVYCEASSPKITNCTVANNTGYHAGGIYCLSASPVINNCTIADNTATDRSGGGIFCNGGSNPTIINCAIIGNTASLQHGGGIYCYISNPTVINCLIANNVASYGSGIYCTSANPTVINCTIANNSASYGGGICCLTSTATLNNSILWSNTASVQGNQIFVYDAPSTAALNFCAYASGPNDVAGAGTVTPNNCVTDDPQFVDTGKDNYRLHSASPCIDAGNNSLVSSNLTEDLDGSPRIIDGDKNQTETVDLGSYEYAPLTAQLLTETFMPNNTLPGASKWFSIDIQNTGQYQIVLTPDTRLEFWDTQFLECKFSVHLSEPANVIRPGTVSHLRFDEVTIPQEVPSGRLALRLIAFTTRDYSHTLDVADRLSLVPDLLIVDAWNSPYKVYGNCDFVDIWVKEGGKIVFKGASRQFAKARDVTNEEDFDILPGTELVLTGRNMTITDKGRINLVGMGYFGDLGPGAGNLGLQSECGGGGGGSIARKGHDAPDAFDLVGRGGKEHKRERMGSGGGSIIWKVPPFPPPVTPTSSEGGGSIAILLTGKLTNNGEIDVSGNEGAALPELECGTGGGGGGTIFIWSDVVEGIGLFKALGGKGGGKDKVPHPGGDGAGGYVRICWVSQLTINPETQIEVGDGAKAVALRTSDQYVSEILPYVQIILRPPRTLAEYQENGVTPDREKLIEIIQPALSQEQLFLIFQKLKIEVEGLNKLGQPLDCAVAKYIVGIGHCIEAKPFLKPVKIPDYVERVGFDASDFVGKAEVSVSVDGVPYGRQEYLVLAGKWPTPGERITEVRKAPGKLPPPEGYNVGLANTGKEWTIITEQRFHDAKLEFLDFDDFNCYAWAVGMWTEEFIFHGNVENAKDTYGEEPYLLTPLKGFVPGAKIFLMARARRVTHAYAPVGLGYYTSKMGWAKVDPVILHTKEHIDPGPSVKDRKKNFYGGTIQSYVPK